MKRSRPASASRERAAPAKFPRRVVAETAGRKQIVRGNLHDEVAVSRGGELVDMWRVAARGPRERRCAMATLWMSRPKVRRARVLRTACGSPVAQSILTVPQVAMRAASQNKETKERVP